MSQHQSAYSVCKGHGDQLVYPTTSAEMAITSNKGLAVLVNNQYHFDVVLQFNQNECKSFCTKVAAANADVNCRLESQ